MVHNLIARGVIVYLMIDYGFYPLYKFVVNEKPVVHRLLNWSTNYSELCKALFVVICCFYALLIMETFGL